MKKVFSILTITLSTFSIWSCSPDTTMQSAPVDQQEQDRPAQEGLPPTPMQIPVGGNSNYTNSQLPPITIVYSLTVEVLAAPNSISGFSLEGRSDAIQYGNYGRASGYITGETSGKGFLRVKVLSFTIWDPFNYAHPSDETNSNLVSVGGTYILKMIDSKSSALSQGDRTIIMCRVDQELLDPVGVNEVPFLEEVVKELDLCRMLESKFTPPLQ